MIYILLAALRWIGVVLLVLILLFLAIAVCLLFVPVRYSVAGVWKDKKEGEAHLTWLLHLVHLRAGYGQRAEGFWYDLRILGFSIFNSKSGDENAEERTEPISRSSGHTEKTKQAEGTQYKHERAEKKPYVKNADEEEPYEQRQAEDKPCVKGTDKEELHKQGQAENGSYEKNTDKEEPHKHEQAGNKTGAKKTRINKRIKKPLIKRISAKKKKRASGKKRVWKNPFKSLISIQRFFVQLKQKWEFLADEKNQASFRFLLRQGMRLLAHIRPRRGRMNIEFGFDDPAATGQALAAYSLLYPFLHEHLEVIPQFEKTVFEAEGELKGRLRAAVPLWLLWEIFRDRHTWRLLKSRNTANTG